MESIVTLPMNIKTISTALLAMDSLKVIPSVRPTVLYAEKHSKAI
nr:hypothetical protein [Sphingobacterium sp. 1.A.4]